MSIKLDTSKLETSNEELLQGIITTGLSAMEYHSKLDALKDKEEVSAYLMPVASGMEQLNKSWDPALANEVQDALDVVRTQAINKDYDLPYRTGLAQAYKFGQIGLDQLRVRENMLDDAKNEMEAIYENTSALKTMSPEFLDVVDRVGFNKSELVTQAHNSNVDRVKFEIDDLVKKSEAATMIIGMDANKEREGVQVKMGELSTAVYDRALSALGFGKVKEPQNQIEGTMDYYLPDDMEINIVNYDEAKQALTSYRDTVMEEEVKLIEQAETASDMEVFEVMNEWALAPSTTTQAHKFQAIMDQVFHDDPNDMPTSMLFIDESDRHDVKHKVRMLEDLKKSGKYPQAIAALQSLDIQTKQAYAKIKETILEDAQDTAKDVAENLTSEVSSNILISTGTVNKQITAWNQGHTEDFKMPHITVYSDIDKIKGTVDLNKRLHTDVLDKLLQERGDLWGWSNTIDKEPLMKDFQDAKSYLSKYQAIDQLIRKYLYSDGSDRGIADDIWKEDAVPLFISVLQSFDWLLKANPSGRVSASTL